jgi:hypothetical protein
MRHAAHERMTAARCSAFAKGQDDPDHLAMATGT